MEKIQLHLYKQKFKFSAAHFLIFDEHRAERLHGHNYQVQVDLEIPAEFVSLDKADEKGYFIDFKILKDLIEKELNQWDEFVLLPKNHPEMKITEKNSSSLEVQFRERLYVFPKNEVRLLPITNTSVEQLSRLLARKIRDQINKDDESPLSLKVSIEETCGQSASFLLE